MMPTTKEAIRTKKDTDIVAGLWQLDSNDKFFDANPKRITVLVIEDNPTDFEDILDALLQMDLLHANVLHADDIMSARMIAERNQIDFALVDFRMIMEAGMQLIQDICGRYDDCPVVTISDVPGQEMPQLAINAGAINHLNKNDLSSALLETTIRSSMNTHGIETRLKNTIIELERANRSRDNFFARMSHELKTPLNAILGYSEAIELGAFGEAGADEYREKAGCIHKAGAHLLEVINSLIIEAAGEGNSKEHSHSTISLDKIVSEATSVVSFYANSSNHDVLIDISESDIFIDCQAPLIVQAMTNLLSNAIKYSPPVTQIFISATKHEDFCEIQVKDHGIGMNEKEIELALLPFGRIDSSDHTPKEGTGVGLPIVQEIVEAHSGFFDIKSAPGEGTTAIIRLPLAKSIKNAA